MDNTYENIWNDLEKKVRRELLENKGHSNGRNSEYEVALGHVLQEMEDTVQTVQDLKMNHVQKIELIKFALYFHIQLNDDCKEKLRAYKWALKTLERIEGKYVRVRCFRKSG